MEEKWGQESIQMSLITTASCFLKHCHSSLMIGRVLLFFFFSFFFGRQHVFWHSLSCRLSALIATVTSCFLEQGSTDDVRQFVCGWWNWSQVFDGFCQYLPVLFSRLSLIILNFRRRRSSHSRTTVRAFAHLILHKLTVNHVNDLRNARFWANHNSQAQDARNPVRMWDLRDVSPKHVVR